jgi:2-polyprenyl-3-methyl-5-hydroxy-6-metoxy-1,4-benzoquinol methylase
MDVHLEPIEWLQQNKNLRMDANLDVFPEARRRFHLARYQFARHYCKGKKVLDGACGTGYGAALMGQSARNVTGIDCSADAIEYAVRTYGNASVRFRRSFVESTPFASGSFDVVVSLETVEHTLCPESHMMEIVRLLNPACGLAILSVPNAWGLTDHHFLDFNMEMFERMIRKFFGAVQFFYQNPESHLTLPGIGLLQSSTSEDAQCLIAVCTKPRVEAVVADQRQHVMDEIYRIAFSRHNDYLTLAYRDNTSLLRRVITKIRSLV